jgi:hypothetical protein
MAVPSRSATKGYHSQARDSGAYKGRINMPVPPQGAQRGNISAEMVLQAGKAVAQVQNIRRAYTQRIEASESDEDKQELSQQCEVAAIQAVEEQGLSADQYNTIIQAAESDAELREDLLAAARLE